MLISLPTLLAFCATVLLIEATPGPNMGWLAIVAASQGRNAGLSAVAGVGVGLLFIGLAAAAGLGALVLASPVLFNLLRYAGAAYLLWLAFDAWRDAGETSAGLVHGEKPGRRRHFVRGFFINVLNPKAAVFYISMLPAFIDTTANITAQVLALTFLSVFIATAVHGLIVLFAGAAQPFLEDPARLRIARRFMAVAIGIIAVWFAVSAGR